MNRFISDINNFFKSNNKIVIWENKNEIPKIKDNINKSNLPIHEYPFSSGERQIITILFNINFFEKKKLLILIDEIEISLGLDWQELLYEKIKENHKVELIGVTHSPFVVSEKDFSKVLKAFANGS